MAAVGRWYKQLDELWARKSAGALGANGYVLPAGMTAYMRCTQRVLAGRRVHSIDLASVEVVKEKDRGRGRFTGWLVLLEEYAEQHGAVLYVENVLHERFQEFWRKRGYTELVGATPPCFYRPCEAAVVVGGKRNGVEQTAAQ